MTSRGVVMKKLFGLCLLLLSVVVYAEMSANLTVSNFNWHQANSDYIENSLKEGRSDSLLPVINMLGTIWQYRDGAIGSQVTPSIAMAIIYQPEEMFTWFEKHPQAYVDWLSELPSNLLTDYEGNRTIELSKLKDTLVNSLRAYEPTPNLLGLTNRLITKLEKTEIRVID